MKIAKTTILFALAIGLISCGGEKKEAAKTETNTEMTEAKEASYAISIENSKVVWKGTMMGMYSHEGDIALKSGALSTKGGIVIGGDFVIDMKTINPTDDNFGEENPREYLIGHLGTGDFFASDSIPTASFKITGAEGNSATGDLTIKGVTKSATITDITVAEENGMVTATGNLVFNRQDFGIAYKAAKDMVLSDDIELTISLSGKAN